MSNESFDGQALTEKLSKFNNSQQSIESLSKWCISYRKKAKQIVETWEKLFNSSKKEQRISFLYLSNDILQNSRRKGSEFVNEFWKVLPGALKRVYESGDEPGKKVVTRLIDIWEGRKVFGSRGKSLKDEILGINSTPLSVPVSQVKSPNPIRILKRDEQAVRIKLAVGGLPEKIITCFESVLDDHLNEEATLEKCSTAIRCVGKIEEDVENSGTQGNQLELGVQDELQEQENLLNQCIVKLETSEAARISLVLQLKEALQEQEFKLAQIRQQLQDGRRQLEKARNIRKSTTAAAAEQSQQAGVSFAPLDEDAKKAAAAAVVARLAASTSSAQMLTSVLSSLVAEEAAAGLSTMFSPEKRQKLLDDSSTSSTTAAAGSTAAPGFFAPISTMMQSNFAPPPPPPPPLPQPQPQLNQYVGAMPYAYGSNTLPPPPPPLSVGPTAAPAPHFSMGISMPGQPQQQAANGGFYRPPGMGFYGQNQQPATPPVHRQ